MEIIMKKSAFVFCALLALCLAQQSIAQIPRVISYQGVLNRGDKPLTGDTRLVFKLYRGNQIGWTSLPLTVHVDNGLFGVLLGPFPQEFTFDGIDSLGVTFDGMELSPRIALSAAPFSINSSHSILADSAKNPGPPGLKGDKGDIGLTGVAGLVGNAGATGLKGDAGLLGAAGAKGDKGDIGLAGPTGAAGAASTVAGPTGVAGATGAASTVAGPTGATGAASTIAGPTGPTGAAGAASTVAGPTGPTGAAGAASTVAGPTGAAGAASTVAGPTGPTGATGAASIVAGPTGSTGATGSQGIKGDIGVNMFSLTVSTNRVNIFSLNNVALVRSGDALTLSLENNTAPPLDVNYSAFWHKTNAVGTSNGMISGGSQVVFDVSLAYQFSIMMKVGNQWGKIDLFRVDLAATDWYGSWTSN
jgi:hypothetical protein